MAPFPYEAKKIEEKEEKLSSYIIPWLFSAGCFFSQTLCLNGFGLET